MASDGIKLTRGNKILVGLTHDSATPFYSELPGVIAVIGQQNVGKSVTTTFLIAGMHRAGVKLSICDLHASKDRSLSKMIYPIAPWFSTATTPPTILNEVLAFHGELVKRRESGTGPMQCLVIDELAATLRCSDTHRSEITQILKETAQEGHGYGLFMLVVAHDITKEGVGDAQLRSFFNWVMCHRTDSNQTKFLGFSTKAQRIAQKLEPGEVLMRDESYDFRLLKIPEYGWREMAVVAEGTRRLGIDTIHPHFELENTPYSVNGKIHEETTEPLEPLYDSEPSIRQLALTAVDEKDVNAYKLALREVVSRSKLWKQLGWHSRKYEVFEQLCEQLGL
jgi:hypothetical protein